MCVCVCVCVCVFVEDRGGRGRLLGNSRVMLRKTMTLIKIMDSENAKGQYIGLDGGRSGGLCSFAPMAKSMFIANNIGWTDR